MTSKPMTARAASLTLALLLGVTGASAQQSLDASAKEPGAVVSPSGLVFRSLKEGTGAMPKTTDTVKVHYRGTLPDGNEFDSSYKRNAVAEFPLDRVIPCWTEGVSRMKVGGKAKLSCPAAIAYGARGTPGGPIPPNATLFFEVELLGINGR
jgi:FKBP-type peptidyl-prolyl cis-trans isomerase FkpA